MKMNLLEVKCVSSLSKVFPDSECMEEEYTCGSALRGEVFSFQAAYRAERMVKGLHVEVDTGALKVQPQVRRVGLAPSEMPTYGGGDDFVLRDTPGLYPDPLFPVSPAEEIYAYPGQWRSIWVTLSVPEDAKEGSYPIRIRISGTDDPYEESGREWYGEQLFTLQVLPGKLPKSKLFHTEWFAADCISTWYGLSPLTPAWWEMIRAYVKNAAEHGINMLLTPLFTPPLDTRIGGERPTVQLMEITRADGRYDFDFENLGKWVSMAKEEGIEYFEIPHLFTQWGAKFTPKIIVRENGEEKKLFGWHVESESREYLDFLEQLLPKLIDYLKTYVREDQIFFHVSDEPKNDSLERYGRLSKVVKRHIGDCPVIDALSDYELFEKSLLTSPVTAVDSVDPFFRKNVKNMWVYYCCAQYQNCVPNRFFAMPSSRNRILGMLMYKYNIQGFLHWGYNFWYSGLSVKKLNPFLDTDGDGSFPSGDAFLVYPGGNGPVNSIRMEVLREAFQDYSALCLLESLVGREEAMKLLEEGIPPLTFQQYPREKEWLLRTRGRINEKIKDALYTCGQPVAGSER